MRRMFASVTTPSELRTRHYVGLPSASDRTELPRPSVALIEEKPDGFFLVRLAIDGAFGGDTWHLTFEDARDQAGYEFEHVGAWRDIPDEVSDAQTYAVSHAGLT